MGRTGRRGTGRLACRHAIAALALSLLAAGCTSQEGPLDGDRTAPTPPACGPLAYDDVRGRAPSYGPEELGRFHNDQYLCAGVWAPGADRWLVPQGMTVADDGTSYLAGFDGTKPARQRYCSLERVDLGTGRLVGRVDPVRGSIGGAAPIICRHGGGLVLDEHGLWLAETRRLWLIDPDTLQTVCGWELAEPVKGCSSARRGSAAGSSPAASR